MPLGQSKKATGHESPIGDHALPLAEWTIVRLVAFRKPLAPSPTAKWIYRKEEPRLRFARKDNGLTA